MPRYGSEQPTSRLIHLKGHRQAATGAACPAATGPVSKREGQEEVNITAADGLRRGEGGGGVQWSDTRCDVSAA